MRKVVSRADAAAGQEKPEARFARLYEEQRRDLLAYALRRTPSPEDAADLVAEVFLVAWRRLEDVPPGAEARLWLYGVTRRLLANQLRGERRRVRLAERLRADLAGGLGSEPAPEERTDVLRALARLGSDDREVLMLAGWEELTPGEISHVLGIPAATARTRLHRARRRFRAELKAEAGCRTPRQPGLELEEAR